MTTPGPSGSHKRAMSADFDLVAQLPSHQITLDGNTWTQSKSNGREDRVPTFKRILTTHSTFDEGDSTKGSSLYICS